MSHISYIQYKTIKEMEDYKQTLYNDELLNILPDGVIIFDTNGEVIQLNQQAFAELHVHPSVNDMLPFPTNRLFKLLNKKEDILSTILEKIRQGENTYSLIESSFPEQNAPLRTHTFGILHLTLLSNPYQPLYQEQERHYI